VTTGSEFEAFLAEVLMLLGLKNDGFYDAFLFPTIIRLLFSCTALRKVGKYQAEHEIWHACTCTVRGYQGWLLSHQAKAVIWDFSIPDCRN